MMKILLAAALALALAGAAGGCRMAPPYRAPHAEDIERLVERLDGENPFLFSDARTRLVRIGRPALDPLERAALDAPTDPADDCLHRRNIIQTISMIAERHPDATAQAGFSLIRIAIETPYFVALNAVQELDKFNEDEVRQVLLRIATDPEETRRHRARVVLFAMDKKAAADLILDIMSGERSVRWYRSPARPAGPGETREYFMDVALQNWTLQNMGYAPGASAEERRAAISRWVAWWSENRETFDRLFQLEDYLPLLREMEARSEAAPAE